MDLIRSAIKSLLYDYPLDAVAGFIRNGNYRDSADFHDRISELMTWREKGFSSSEISLLKGVLDGDWLVDNETGFGIERPYHPYERIFLLFQKCANQLLNLQNDQPAVEFRHLLRWRELTLLVGEDNLIIPFLARHDLLTNHKRTSFLWQNILGHDDVQLNGLLKETISDTHFHLNAGCDVFEFNWIIIMNHPEVLTSSDKSVFFKKQERRDYDPVSRYSELNLPLAQWICIAAYIRALITHLLLTENSDSVRTTLPNEIFSPHEDYIFRTVTPRMIEAFRRKAIRTSNGIIFDYAINIDTIDGITDSQLTDVFMAHHGERFLLYNFIKRYLGGDEKFRRFAPCVYLYLLIKNKIRREIIQTNNLRGFRNFQLYQNYKTVFFRNADDYRKITETAFRYAVQSAVGKEGHHFVEARVTPGSVEAFRKLDYTKSLFGNKEVLRKEDAHLTLICHFIKQEDSSDSRTSRKLRHEKFRKSLRRDLEKVKLAWSLNNSDGISTRVTGIDAASDELPCRPEVFGPVFREARRFGITNMTYHVGEDFYDIVDGLRAIDEAIQFLDLSSGSRLGHALALGMDPDFYYSKRHRYIIIPAQILLDNLVWMMFKAMDHNIRLQPKTSLFICEEFAALTESLGYGECKEAQYWESMKRRGDDPAVADVNTNLTVYHLLDIYWHSTETRKQGNKVLTKRLPESFVEDVKKIQDSIFSEIEQKGLFIETNPTSNLMIGGFGKYIDLPLFQFHSVGTEGHKLPVSINTDDKGVFATSLTNEYSLVAAALRKEKDPNGNRMWNDKQIVDYLRQIARYGNLSRFTV